MDNDLLTHVANADLDATRYIDCMLSIKERMTFIRTELAKGCLHEEKLIKTEIICHQFRCIFELILLSSLAAHENYYQKNFDKIKKMWRIEFIIEELGTINEYFYPRPMTYSIEISEDGSRYYNLLPNNADSLTLDIIKDAYHQCCGYIHPKNPFKENKDYKIWLSFEGWLMKIFNLLSFHLVMQAETKRALYIGVDFRPETSMVNSVTFMDMSVKPK